MESIRRFLKTPHQSFFLFGPRGTGKSTWVSAVFPEAVKIDLLDNATYHSYLVNPDLLRDTVKGRRLSQKVILIDEIQKVPALLSVCHALIEEDKSLMFVLTGSSSRKLKRSGVDLLGGRALLKTMHPFLAAELKEKFQFNKALQEGLLPLVWNSPNSSDVLKAYAALYIREEVQMEGLVRNIGNFSRFLTAISFSHGSLLNVSNIARECQVDRRTVDGFVSILEDLLLGFRLPVFTKRAKREQSVHPKFYFFDAGVFRSLRPQGPLDSPHEIDGQALEGLVAQHLRAWISYQGEERTLGFWRTRSGVEVDFVVYGAGIFFAVEVKNTPRVRDEDLNGLTSFLEDYPQSKAYFLYRGKERLKRKNILCLPCEEFLRNLDPHTNGIT